MMGTFKTTYHELDASGALPEQHEGKFVRFTVFSIVSAMCVLFFWAAVTPVDELTSGHGVITTQAKAERVEHPDGGVIHSISVSTGKRVEAGQQLVLFDTSSLERELEKLLASRATLMAEIGRVNYLLEDKGEVPDFVSVAELSPEELLFWAEQTFLDAQLGLIDADSRALLPRIDNLNARRESIREEYKLVQSRLGRNREGQKSGAIALSAIETLEREALQLQRSILEIDNEILVQETALTSNQLRKVEVRAKRSRDAALRRSEIGEQLVAVKASIREVEARIDRATVRASISGTIMELGIANANEVVAPGELIAEIIPSGERVEAEVEILADKIGSVTVGMSARLKVLSYDFTRYGEIVGEVTAISPSSYQDENGNTVFRVTVSLPNEGKEPLLASKPVLPGMTVSAEILTDSKKVLSYLLKPLRALSRKLNRPVVITPGHITGTITCRNA